MNIFKVLKHKLPSCIPETLGHSAPASRARELLLHPHNLLLSALSLANSTGKIALAIV